MPQPQKEESLRGDLTAYLGVFYFLISAHHSAYCVCAVDLYISGKIICICVIILELKMDLQIVKNGPQMVHWN